MILFINATDLSRLQVQFGYAEPVTGEAIPEPTLTALLGMGGLALLRRRRTS